MKTTQLILLLILTVQGFSQETVPASGGTVSGTSGSFSFTVGQPMYGFAKNAAQSVSEGVQQTNTAKINLNMEQFRPNSELVVYPNPVIDNITITNTNTISSVEVISLLGQRVLSARPEALSTTLDMNGLPVGTYLIEVQSEGKTSTVKIIKGQ